ncbi:retropepsin-like aspartic protease family protein [Reyranella sp.]|uniref:retropepsin-like aspartic protease family protein n=1 Tax=Reyranella sp. TaxID=1929291 RepID=UPI003BAC3BFE
MMRTFLVGMVTAAVAAGTAGAQSPRLDTPVSPHLLGVRWTESDVICRNQAVSARAAIAACEQRDTLSKLLALASYCPRTDRSGSWSACADGPTAAGAGDTTPFQRVGGVFALSATLNGQGAAHFILDSGAATVQIPAETVEALTKAGTLTESDYMGQHRFILADGSAMQQRVFRLRTLQIGGRTMENVLATVGAPRSRALLGQSFLRRLSSWKVDNVRNALDFEYVGAF